MVGISGLQRHRRTRPNETRQVKEAEAESNLPEGLTKNESSKGGDENERQTIWSLAGKHKKIWNMCKEETQTEQNVVDTTGQSWVNRQSSLPGFTNVH